MTVHRAAINRKEYEQRVKEIEDTKIKINQQGEKLERIVEVENRLPVHLRYDYDNKQQEIDKEVEKLLLIVNNAQTDRTSLSPIRNKVALSPIIEKEKLQQSK